MWNKFWKVIIGLIVVSEIWNLKEMLVNKLVDCVFWVNFIEEIYYEICMIVVLGRFFYIFMYFMIIIEKFLVFLKLIFVFVLFLLLFLIFKLKGIKYDVVFVNLLSFYDIINWRKVVIMYFYLVFLFENFFNIYFFSLFFSCFEINFVSSWWEFFLNIFMFGMFGKM